MRKPTFLEILEYVKPRLEVEVENNYHYICNIAKDFVVKFVRCKDKSCFFGDKGNEKTGKWFKRYYPEFYNFIIENGEKERNVYPYLGKYEWGMPWIFTYSEKVKLINKEIRRLKRRRNEKV